jgi:hypothetical protein
LLENNTALQALRGAAALSEFGVTIGETLSPPYGLAGQRFEQSREQFTLTRPGLRIVQGRALRVERLAAGYRVSVAGPAPNQTQDFEAARCVLALGGASSGALQLDAVHHLRLGLELSPPQPLQHRGRPWLQPAAETGVDLQAFGMQAVLELGLPETLEPGRLQVVGDLVADRPRSLLRAAQSGLDAVS